MEASIVEESMRQPKPACKAGIPDNPALPVATLTWPRRGEWARKSNPYGWGGVSGSLIRRWEVKP